MTNTQDTNQGGLAPSLGISKPCAVCDTKFPTYLTDHNVLCPDCKTKLNDLVATDKEAKND